MSDAETRLLDNLYYNPSSFFEEPFFQSSIVGLFLRLHRAFQAEFGKAGKSIENQLLQLADLVARKHYHYKAGSDNYKYSIGSVSHELRNSLMKLSENAIRERYDYKRRLQVIPPFANTELTIAIETHLIMPATDLLPELLKTCPEPDEKTEVAINRLSPTRWKTKFVTITESFITTKDIRAFKEQIFRLAKENKTNPAIENIFFEASKFIGRHDKPLCLSLYTHYIFYDQRSAQIDDKPLTKTIQKAAFTDPDQEARFNLAIDRLKKNKDLKQALSEITTLFRPARRKVELNNGRIKVAEQALQETVELLNVYLSDEEDEAPTSNPTGIPMVRQEATRNERRFVADLSLNSVQTNLLIRFERHDFVLTGDDLDDFARSQNSFKNQLINSINEACFEHLDDTLIETEGDNYILNEDYYKRILSA